jgi:hypothetical protein
LSEAAQAVAAEFGGTSITVPQSHGDIASRAGKAEDQSVRANTGVTVTPLDGLGGRFTGQMIDERDEEVVSETVMFRQAQ